MSNINATIVADSINPQGDRITTMLVTFPRFILAELNTHRMFSRNSASSRAIPFEKMVKMVQEDPFIPIAWQKDHKGMQGTEYFTSDIDIEANEIKWNAAKERAIKTTISLHDLGVTKQLCNRLLEPFMWHTVLITATEWENFFALRCPQYEFNHKTFKSKKDALVEINKILGESDFNDVNDYLQWTTLNKGMAEIHMMLLAEAMWDAMNESIPKQLKAGEWHIPFEDKIILPPTIPIDAGLTLDEGVAIRKVKISTAMAARTSYTVVGDEKEFSYDKQISLHDRMANQVPFHASPFEHCARAMSDEEYGSHVKGWYEQPKYSMGHLVEQGSIETNAEGWCRNYKGFIQYREILEHDKS
jgi:thymidylate synthase ThyX